MKKEIDIESKADKAVTTVPAPPPSQPEVPMLRDPDTGLLVTVDEYNKKQKEVK